MLKDTKSLGNNKAPACESRGFVRKKQKVCILTHLHFFYNYVLGEVSSFSFLRMFLGESPKDFLQKLEKCERDSNPCPKQISEMEASV